MQAKDSLYRHKGAMKEVLTLFLVLAGWSHFAQFTIAVVNKDPKKSKYSGQSTRTHT